MFERNVKYLNNNLDFVWTSDGFLQNNGPVLGNAFGVKNYRNILVTIVGTGTVNFFGSIQKNPPKFEVASTLDNTWTNVMSADYSDVSLFYTGAVGVTVTGATKTVEINTNLLTWFGIKRSVNTVDVIITVTENS